ncbi:MULTISPECIES: flagellar hook-basal body protein [unclassified Paenibacillus]|uniref:flagellar hook-basal body protein n=1 Tax=unclassified Paenibacillus TaxID=185978 RepID=UPI001AEA7BEE|nr:MULTISPECIES: flagellar hook-basal body protein [unclassified Paenibacillus]MBP1157829.1 flagellar basal-body rod protein FlgG [Paenibacillus sp. PvP091]MBP1171435.1 flagellar basal-body rod protein FlgG [Paenibacillus sp. PvR098]MBP2442463.1 flagellar basal-body rod protein FlgG [Paenibacillus sp. PvP052]
MNNSMIKSSVSMHALQQKLDLIANNIANVNTTGYKRREASFQDVLTSVQQQPTGFQREGRLTPLGYNQGWGAKLVESQLNLAQGSLKATDSPLDTAIEGNGLFEISAIVLDAENNPVQSTRWTRTGAFELSPSADPLDPDGMFLITKDGHYVVGADNNPIRIPNNHRILIGTDGTIMAYNDAEPGAVPIEAGQIKMVRVVRPQLLQQLGDNLYGMPANVTPAQQEEILQIVTAANNAVDPITVRQGFLEQSNVNLSDEMTELMTVQRAYQLNSRAVSSSDQMLNLANSLRG